MQLDIRLGVKNEQDADWSLYAASNEDRKLQCDLDNKDVCTKIAVARSGIKILSQRNNLFT